MAASNVLTRANRSSPKAPNHDVPLDVLVDVLVHVLPEQLRHSEKTRHPFSSISIHFHRLHMLSVDIGCLGDQSEPIGNYGFAVDMF